MDKGKIKFNIQNPFGLNNSSSSSSSGTIALFGKSASASSSMPPSPSAQSDSNSRTISPAKPKDPRLTFPSPGKPSFSFANVKDSSQNVSNFFQKQFSKMSTNPFPPFPKNAGNDDGGDHDNGNKSENEDTDEESIDAFRYLNKRYVKGNDTISKIASMPPGSSNTTGGINDADVRDIEDEVSEHQPSQNNNDNKNANASSSAGDLNDQVMFYDVEFYPHKLGMTMVKSVTTHSTIVVGEFSGKDSVAYQANVKVGDVIVSLRYQKQWIMAHGNINKVTAFIKESSRPIVIRFARISESFMHMPTLSQVLEDDDGKKHHFLEFLNETFPKPQEKAPIKRERINSSGKKRKNNSDFGDIGQASAEAFEKFKEFMNPDRDLLLNVHNAYNENEEHKPRASSSPRDKGTNQKGIYTYSSEEDKTEVQSFMGDSDYVYQSSFESRVLFYVETSVFLEMVKKRDIDTLRKMASKLIEKYILPDAPFAVKFKPSIEYSADMLEKWYGSYDKLLQTSSSNSDHVEGRNDTSSSNDENNVSLLNNKDETEVNDIVAFLVPLKADAYNGLLNPYRRFLHSFQAIKMFSEFEINFVKDPLSIGIDLETALNSRPLCNMLLFYLIKKGTATPLVIWIMIKFTILPSLEEVINIASNEASYIVSKDSEESERLETEKTNEVNSFQLKILQKSENLAKSISYTLAKSQQLDRDNIIISPTERDALMQLLGQLRSACEQNDNEDIRNQIDSLLSELQDKIINVGMSCNKMLQDRLHHAEEDSYPIFSAVANIIQNNDEVPRISSIVNLVGLPNHVSIHRSSPQNLENEEFSLASLSEKSKLLKYVTIFCTDNATVKLKAENILPSVSSTSSEDSQPDFNSKVFTNFFVPEGVNEILPLPDLNTGEPTSPDPYMFNFVIGGGGGSSGKSKLFGTSLVVYEKSKDKDVYYPSGVCLLSEYPIYTTMKRWLAKYLFPNIGKPVKINHDSVKNIIDYSLSVDCINETISRLIGPTSSLRKQDGLDSISQLGPQKSFDLYPIDFSFLILFRVLKIENIISLFAQCLIERKILLLSQNYSVLLAVGEALRTLLHPLSWNHVYSPVLPSANLNLLQCPTPFIIGIHQSYAFLDDFPVVKDMVVVDLDNDKVSVPPLSNDTGMVSQSEMTQVNHKFPQKWSMQLKQKIFNALYPQIAYADQLFALNEHSESSIEKNIRKVFQSTVESLLRDVPRYCIECDHLQESVVVFDERKFLKLIEDEEEKGFYRLLLKSQAINDFICREKNI